MRLYSFLFLLLFLNATLAKSLPYITAEEYAAFLNDTATRDVEHCYDEKMEADTALFREGMPGNYSYFVKWEEAKNFITLVDGNSARSYLYWKQQHADGSHHFLLAQQKTSIDEALKANDFGLLLTDSKGSKAEEGQDQQIASSTEWWIGAGLVSALLGAYGIKRVYFDQASPQSNRAVMRRNHELIVSRPQKKGIAIQLRERTDLCNVRFDHYFKEENLNPLAQISTDHFQCSKIINALNQIKKESKKVKTKIPCFSRNSSINNFFLTRFRKQLFSSVMSAGLQGSGASLETARIVEEINAQQGRLVALVDYCSPSWMMPDGFVLRRYSLFAKALEDDLKLTSEQQNEILSCVRLANKELSRQRGCGQGMLSTEPKVCPIQLRYPYVTDKEAVRIAMAPDHCPIPPPTWLEWIKYQLNIDENPEEKIRECYIYEIVNLINVAQKKNPFLKKNFFEGEIQKGHVTPMTAQLLNKMNLFSFIVQNKRDAWIDEIFKRGEIVAFGEIEKTVRESMR